MGHILLICKRWDVPLPFLPQLHVSPQLRVPEAVEAKDEETLQAGENIEQILEHNHMPTTVAMV